MMIPGTNVDAVCEVQGCGEAAVAGAVADSRLLPGRQRTWAVCGRHAGDKLRVGVMEVLYEHYSEAGREERSDDRCDEGCALELELELEELREDSEAAWEAVLSPGGVGSDATSTVTDHRMVRWAEVVCG